jgi:hypothetical protein
MNEDILNELKQLNAKVDSLTAMVSGLVAKKERSQSKKGAPKPAPLTEEEISRLQEQFNRLYTRWLNNEEAAIREELEAMSADDLRRLADANNLNVTLKTPKDRVIQLIGFRFREKKQLSPPTRT